ncbi:hypothetical protein [Prochlorococcus sp. MIT 1306]|uniref:hypothetical protein n=1 Tax=Prochlorococcus sp. MIT 1306 TaxID=1799667 RepID=UPI0007B39AFB|nr:hypothetical protein [Prochlorococcus sp. MIT 1306]KZR61434.1 hypothetical protein PMIT1306_02215 [Prochlorococcus sp. MIT 1306]
MDNTMVIDAVAAAVLLSEVRLYQGIQEKDAVRSHGTGKIRPQCLIDLVYLFLRVQLGNTS